MRLGARRPRRIAQAHGEDGGFASRVILLAAAFADRPCGQPPRTKDWRAAHLVRTRLRKRYPDRREFSGKAPVYVPAAPGFEGSAPTEAPAGASVSLAKGTGIKLLDGKGRPVSESIASVAAIPCNGMSISTEYRYAIGATCS